MNHLALLAIASAITSSVAPPRSSNAQMFNGGYLDPSSHIRRGRRDDCSATKGPSSAPTVIEIAKRHAMSEPRINSYVGDQQIYPFSDGMLYRLYTAPLFVSEIALEPGETLLSVGAGDTARWIIGDTASGSGPAHRVHVLVKPSLPGLSTNLVIATDRRVYHVELKSNPTAAMSSIAWSYPGESLLALRTGALPGQEPAIASGVRVEDLDFDYRIEGDDPPWRPLRAFDDGRQVFIQFPPNFAQNEAPPLFIVGEDGKAELVNYRLRGRYYRVDRLFRAAELRLGGKHQSVVRIVHQGPRAPRRGA